MIQRYPYGCFFIEQHPEDLCGRRERELQAALIDLGYLSGKVCWQAVEGLVNVMLDGRHLGYYDPVERRFLRR